jgi:hypothetical protein
MEEISKIALGKAIMILTALKADYVIQLPDEPIINVGALEVAKPSERKQRQMTVPYGTYSNFLIGKGFDSMQPSDVLLLEPGELDAESLRSSAVSRGCKLWGNGSIMSTIKNNVVELMRLQ